MSTTLVGYSFNTDGSVAPNLTVKVFDQTPTLIGTTTTDVNGRWQFTGLTDGITYDVTVTNNNGSVKVIKGGESHQLANLNLVGSVTAANAWDFSGTSSLKIRSGTQVGPNAGEQIRNPSSSSASLSLESADQFTFLSSRSGSHLAGNSFWDGVNWNLFDTTVGSGQWITNGAGVVYNTLSAGTNPRTPSTRLSIDLAGNLLTTGKLQGTNGVFSGITGTTLTTIGIDSSSSNFAFTSQNAAGTNLLYVRNDGSIYAAQAGTSAAQVSQFQINGNGWPNWLGYNSLTSNSPGTLQQTQAALFINDVQGATGDGGVILFGATGRWWAGIKGFFTDGTNNGTGDLSFGTRRLNTDTVITEAMRIKQGGTIDMSMSASTIVNLPRSNPPAILAGNTALSGTAALLFSSTPTGGAGTYLVTAAMEVSCPTANTNVQLTIVNGGRTNGYSQTDTSGAAGTNRCITLTGLISVGASDPIQVLAATSTAATAIELDSNGFAATYLNYIRVA